MVVSGCFLCACLFCVFVCVTPSLLFFCCCFLFFTDDLNPKRERIIYPTIFLHYVSWVPWGESSFKHKTCQLYKTVKVLMYYSVLLILGWSVCGSVFTCLGLVEWLLGLAPVTNLTVDLKSIRFELEYAVGAAMAPSKVFHLLNSAPSVWDNLVFCHLAMTSFFSWKHRNDERTTIYQTTAANKYFHPLIG